MATEHFTDAELACKCGCEGLPSEEIQKDLELLRDYSGHPMVISSGYRCPDYNDQVSSTGRNGPHTKGAFDVLVSGSRAHFFVDCAMLCNWQGIGISQKGPHSERFIHIDKRPLERRTIWSY
jgi:uncharacterized protein YcbK (DUF882 family)